jgi:outer membrane protein assembly factor BamB
MDRVEQEARRPLPAHGIAYGDLLYICSNNGIVTAYKVQTSERVYQQRLSSNGSAHTASPVAADGKLYFANEDGDVFVTKAGPAFEPLATNPVGEVLMATPAISSGMIFIRGQTPRLCDGRQVHKLKHPRVICR